MKTCLKSIKCIQTWRLVAITLGSALAMSLATTAAAANPPNIQSGNATGTVSVVLSPSYQITANQAIPYWWAGGATGLPTGLTFTAPAVFCAGDVVTMTRTVDDGYGSVTKSDANSNPDSNAGHG